MQTLRDLWGSLGQVGRIVLMVLVAVLTWYVIDAGYGWDLLRLVGAM